MQALNVFLVIVMDDNILCDFSGYLKTSEDQRVVAKLTKLCSYRLYSHFTELQGHVIAIAASYIYVKLQLPMYIYIYSYIECLAIFYIQLYSQLYSIYIAIVIFYIYLSCGKAVSEITMQLQPANYIHTRNKLQKYKNNEILTGRAVNYVANQLKLIWGGELQLASYNSLPQINQYSYRHAWTMSFAEYFVGLITHVCEDSCLSITIAAVHVVVMTQILTFFCSSISSPSSSS